MDLVLYICPVLLVMRRTTGLVPGDSGGGAWTPYRDQSPSSCFPGAATAVSPWFMPCSCLLLCSHTSPRGQDTLVHMHRAQSHGHELVLALSARC